MFVSQGNNDDVILSCCLHFCKDKAKDFMPSQRSMENLQFIQRLVHIGPSTHAMHYFTPIDTFDVPYTQMEL